MSKTFSSALAILLTISFVTSATFFIASPRASASGIGCVGGIIGGVVGSLLSVADVPATSKSGNIINSQTAGATIGTCINDLIIVPTLRAMIRGFLQDMTRSTINWINGTSNPTGQPSYVPNLSVHLQSVGDVAALAFISQVATGFNSPFGSAISASLRTNYLQRTSVGGFLAANKSTLPPNINAFLAGNWSQGGAASWFALTTQTKNNPYTLFQAAQSQLGSNVGQAQTNRRQDLLQSGGFLSFCPAGSSSKSSGGGIAPGVSCTSPDGTPVDTTTPGSAIMSYAQANINSGIGQLISAQDLDSAIGSIVSALANKVLGPTGLFGTSRPSSSRSTTIATPTPSSAASSASSLAQTILFNVSTYTTAWQTIETAANTASSSVADLVDFCTVAASNAGGSTAFASAATAQAAAARATLTTVIASVLAQAKAIPDLMKSTTDFALKVQAESTANPIENPTQFGIDVSTLSIMPPTLSDVSSAQVNALTTGAAQANPPGSLTVTGGLVDQMNLLNTNAEALKTTVCDPTSELYVASVIFNSGD